LLLMMRAFNLLWQTLICYGGSYRVLADEWVPGEEQLELEEASDFLDTLYRVFQEGRSLFCEVIVSVIVRKKIYV